MEILEVLDRRRAQYIILRLPYIPNTRVLSGKGKLTVQRIRTFKGEQVNLWIKGQFLHGENKKPIPATQFELNIYIEL